MSRGFTLLELLVALLLVGAMAALLVSGLTTGVRAWETVGTRAGSAQDLHLALQVVARQVEQARRVSGEHDRLEVLSPLPPHLDAAGLVSVQIDAARREGVRELVLRYPRASDEAMHSAVLAAGLQEAQFFYLGRGAAPDGWASRWDPSHGLPRLIRLRLVPRQASGRAAERELVVAPRLGESNARQ